ncbi:MAG: hypothetical protein ACLS70_21350 [[Clostridium] symbiosum]
MEQNTFDGRGADKAAEPLPEILQSECAGVSDAVYDRLFDN